MTQVSKINFLKNKYNVIKLDDEVIGKLVDEKKELGFKVVEKKIIKDNKLGVLVFKLVTNLKRDKTKILISDIVLNLILKNDPSKNKINTEWMLTLFINLIKESNYIESNRFISEDLPLAKDYLEVFEQNKRKKKFKTYCRKSFLLRDIKDYSNLNQYKSLSQLYDAIDPFVVRDASTMFNLLEKYVQLGEAEIPLKSRDYTIYIPKTLEANYMFRDFTSWCTARKDNTNFKGYVETKQGNGDKSNIYIVINNKFFKTDELENDYLYQIHFESKQTQNRVQSNSDFYDDVLLKNKVVRDYFKFELSRLAKDTIKKDDNTYISYLIKYGWGELLFDLIEDDVSVIKFLNKKITKVKGINKFKKLKQLVICGCELNELDEKVGDLNSLEFISLSNNKLKTLPNNIGNLNNLKMMNIIGNPIKKIPDSIKYLDKTNGGSLISLMVLKKDVGEVNYNKIKKLLPTIELN